MSPWYPRTRARAAWAYYMTLAAANAGVANPARGNVNDVPEWLLPPPEEKPGDDQGGGGGAGGGGATGGATAGASGSSARKTNKDGGPTAELEALYPDTTTKDALGVDAVLLLPEYEMVSLTEKSHARRFTLNGRDLVAKIVDFHGTPKHTEWSARTLYDLEWNEVRAYHALKEVQGRVVPEFLYHGSDMNHLWATAVTTYEGASLQKLLDERGALPAGARAKALDALRALHATGVVHGDAALRNAVWRVRGSSESSGSGGGGGAVLWLDLEMASLRGSEDFADDAEFEVAAARELAAVAAELRGVREEVDPPSLERAAPRPMDAPKREDGAGPTSRAPAGTVKRCKVLPCTSCC